MAVSMTLRRDELLVGKNAALLPLTTLASILSLHAKFGKRRIERISSRQVKPDQAVNRQVHTFFSQPSQGPAQHYPKLAIFRAPVDCSRK